MRREGSWVMLREKMKRREEKGRAVVCSRRRLVRTDIEGQVSSVVSVGRKKYKIREMKWNI